MPRYFITTFDHATYHDEEGVDVTDLAALAKLMRRSLADIAAHESREGCDDFAAEARDDAGRLVMTASVAVTVATPGAGAQSNALDGTANPRAASSPIGRA